MSHPLVELARQTLEETVVHHHPYRAPAALVQQFSTPAPVFVTLRTANGDLRGCIGSVMPTTASLAAEVVAESVAAATVSYTHLRAHETVLDIVCRLLLAKKNT